MISLNKLLFALTLSTCLTSGIVFSNDLGPNPGWSEPEVIYNPWTKRYEHDGVIWKGQRKAQLSHYEWYRNYLNSKGKDPDFIPDRRSIRGTSTRCYSTYAHEVKKIIASNSPTFEYKEPELIRDGHELVCYNSVGEEDPQFASKDSPTGKNIIPPFAVPEGRTGGGTWSHASPTFDYEKGYTHQGMVWMGDYPPTKIQVIGLWNAIKKKVAVDANSIVGKKDPMWASHFKLTNGLPSIGNGKNKRPVSKEEGKKLLKGSHLYPYEWSGPTATTSSSAGCSSDELTLGGYSSSSCSSRTSRSGGGDSKSSSSGGSASKSTPERKPLTATAMSCIDETQSIGYEVKAGQVVEMDRAYTKAVNDLIAYYDEKRKKIGCIDKSDGECDQIALVQLSVDYQAELAMLDELYKGFSKALADASVSAESGALSNTSNSNRNGSASIIEDSLAGLRQPASAKQFAAQLEQEIRKNAEKFTNKVEEDREDLIDNRFMKYQEGSMDHINKLKKGP